MDGIAELLPARAGDGDGPLSARVFKIERGPAGDRIAYTRVFSGTMRVRDRFDAGKVTAIRVFADGDAEQRDDGARRARSRSSGVSRRSRSATGSASRAAASSTTSRRRRSSRSSRPSIPPTASGSASRSGNSPSRIR